MAEGFRGLPYGSRIRLEEGLEAANDFRAMTEAASREPGQAGQDNLDDTVLPPEEDDLGSLQDEDEALLFAPSTRPDEPPTAGMAHGPGRGGIPPLTNDELVDRFVERMAQAPDAPQEIRAFARKRGLGL